VRAGREPVHAEVRRHVDIAGRDVEDGVVHRLVKQVVRDVRPRGDPIEHHVEEVPRRERGVRART
jgi:hypothetical protein